MTGRGRRRSVADLAGNEAGGENAEQLLIKPRSRRHKIRFESMLAVLAVGHAVERQQVYLEKGDEESGRAKTDGVRPNEFAERCHTAHLVQSGRVQPALGAVHGSGHGRATRNGNRVVERFRPVVHTFDTATFELKRKKPMSRQTEDYVRQTFKQPTPPHR